MPRGQLYILNTIIMGIHFIINMRQRLAVEDTGETGLRRVNHQLRPPLLRNHRDRLLPDDKHRVIGNHAVHAPLNQKKPHKISFTPPSPLSAHSSK